MTDREREIFELINRIIKEEAFHLLRITSNGPASERRLAQFGIDVLGSISHKIRLIEDSFGREAHTDEHLEKVKP